MLNHRLFAGKQETTQPSRYWSNFRKILVLLLLVAVFCLVPLGLKGWQKKSLVQNIRSHGGAVQFSHGNCKYGICSVPHPKLEVFTGAISSIVAPDSDNFPVNDEFIHSLGDQPHLTSLFLGTHQNPTVMTDQGLAVLTKNPLQNLSITGGSITDQGFNLLGNLSTLKSLRLYDLEFTGELFHRAPAMQKLSHLYLSGSKITNSGLEKLSAFPSLKYLNIMNTRVSGDGLRHLSKLKKLSNLCIDNTGIKANSLHYLTQIKSLNLLGMVGSSTTDSHLQQISSLKSVTFLTLRDSQVTDQGLIPLAKMKSLNLLYLVDTHITDEGIKPLTRIENLTYLDLSNTEITDQAKSDLLQIPQLVGLNVYGTKLSTATIQALRDSGLIVESNKPPSITY